VAAGARPVSSGVVRFSDVPFEGHEGTLIRDPDGHALVLAH
jgi:hypothetical protein